MLLGLALTMSSCKKDDTTTVAAPTLTLNDGASKSINQDVTTSTTVAIKVHAVAAGDHKMKTVTISRSIPAQAAKQVFTASPGAADYTTTYNDSLGGLVDRGIIVTYTITATDDKDLVSTETYTVNFVHGVVSSNAIILGAQSNTAVVYKFLGVADNFATYTAGATGTAMANSAKIDFVYYYGTNDKNAFASPTNTDGAQVIWSSEIATWTVKNDTKFKSTTITAAEFDAIKDNSKIDASFASLDFAASTSKMTDLKSNDVIAFLTATGKKGLVKFVTTATDNTGAVSLVVICQK